MKVYTDEEVAAILRVDYKTVLRLVQRGLLKVLPGIRHKRVTEQELNRYLDVRSVLSKPVHVAASTIVSATSKSVAVKLPKGKAI